MTLLILIIFLSFPLQAAEKEKAAAGIQNGILTAEVKKSGANLSIIFPFNRETPTAAFLRGAHLWLVFSEHAGLKIPDFAADEYFSGYDQLANQNFTIIRFALADSFRKDASAFSLDFDKSAWVLGVGKAVAPLGPKSPIAVKIQEGKIFLPALKTGEPLKINDPEQGDEIVIIPISTPSVGVNLERKFVDADIEETVQGIVLSNLSDSVRYNVTREGVEISGGRISGINNESKKEKVGPQSVLSFNYKLSGEFMPDRRALDEQIIRVPEKEKSAKRFDLAKLYFSNGFYPDALGALNLIRISDPDFAAAEAPRMLYGAVNYQMRHFTEALKTFEKLEAEDKDSRALPEIKLWRWAANLRLADDAKSADWQQEVAKDKEFLKLHEAYGKTKEDAVSGALPILQQYPGYIRNNFYLMAAREKISLGDYDMAENYLDSINKGGPDLIMQDSANFLHAVINEKRGNFTDAEIGWRKLSQIPEDRRNRVRAELYLTNLELSQGKITKPDAIKRLEPLTVIWRGDQVELELLNYLGQLYFAEKNYLKAFQTWKALVGSFANTSEAVAVAGRMQDNFVKLFDGGEAYNMPPLDALSLFFEFRELTPLGEKGDRIIRKLADHFIEADLLDSAATLLAHQIRYRASGDDKLDLAEKLIDVDLMNKKPGDALEVLDATEMEKMDEPRQQKRKYLRAETLRQMGRNDEALLLLKGDMSARAIEIKDKIFWISHDWKNLVDLLEPQFLLIKKQEPLDEKEAEKAIHLAFAYAFLGDTEKLKQLSKGYAKLIVDEKNQKFFAFLTKNRQRLDKENVEETGKLDDISSYLAEYNKENEPKPKPAEAAPPADASAPADSKAEEPAPAPAPAADAAKPAEKK